MTGRVAACRRLAAAAAALALAMVLAAPIDAQVATGTIVGNVKDNSGRRSRGIGDRRNHQRHAGLAHDDERCGGLLCAAADAGRAVPLEITLSGFKNAEQTGILLEVGRSARRRDDRARSAAGSGPVVANSPLVETNTAARALPHRRAERGAQPAARQS